MDLLEHYQEFFYVTRADTPELLDQAFKLRYEVYIKDFGYKFDNPYAIKKIEKDSYDEQSHHSLIFHKPTNMPIGHIRLIPYSLLVILIDYHRHYIQMLKFYLKFP